MSSRDQVVTAGQLDALFPTLGDRAAAYLDPLNAGMVEFSVNTPARAAAYLAQLGHESLDLTRWVESLSYKPERLLRVFPRLGSLERAREIVDGGPKAIAEAIYGPGTSAGARLGNTQPGDGYRFRGRGPHQLTGRDNYQRHGDVLELDLIADPEFVERPVVGFRSAALFWLSRGLSDFADLGTLEGFRAITKRWNGGLHGLEDRIARWTRAREVFGLPVAEGLVRVGAPKGS